MLPRLHIRDRTFCHLCVKVRTSHSLIEVSGFKCDRTNRETQYKASTDVDSPQMQPIQEFTIEQIWQDVLEHLEPLPYQVLLRHHCQLLSSNGQVAYMSIRSQPLLELAQKNLPNIEAAFEAVFTSKIKVILQTKIVKPPISSSSNSKQQQKSSVQHSYKQNWKVGDCVIHENFGRGQVTHVFGSDRKIALAIRFSSPINQKILDPTREPMQWIESESF